MRQNTKHLLKPTWLQLMVALRPRGPAVWTEPACVCYISGFQPEASLSAASPQQIPAHLFGLLNKAPLPQRQDGDKTQEDVMAEGKYS